MDYKFFIDPKMKASKYLIYKCDSLPIEMVLATEQMHANTIENFNVSIEKHKSRNLIQIRLSSVRDNASIYICTIDDIRFEQFKMEQMLFVTFDSFLNHITEMMEKCRNKIINISLTTVNETNVATHGEQFQLQFYEKGTFKNLVHICIPIMPAPYEVILFQINQTYSRLQEENRILLQKNINFQTELIQKAEQIEQLNGVINGMRTTLNDQENFFKEAHKDKLMRLENDTKNAIDAKNYQIQESEKQINAYKARIDDMAKENSALCEKLNLESKQNAQLRSDGRKALNKINDLNKKLELLDNERLDQVHIIQKNDEIISDLRKQNKNLEQQISKCEKRNHELLAELQAEKNICQIKKDGLKLATEDICNANTIIRRQANEIETLRKKINLRTEVALKQEKLIREASKGKENLGSLIERMDEDMQQISKQNQETQMKIDSIRDRANVLEGKYRDRIDDLHDRIQIILHSRNK